MSQIHFYASTGSRFDKAMIIPLKEGFRAVGVPFIVSPIEEYTAPLAATQVAIVMSVKNLSPRVFREHLNVGKQAILLDKGYTQRIGKGDPIWRLAIDAFQPFHLLKRLLCSPERWYAQNIKVATFRAFGERIILAGASQKYHDFHRLGSATSYATSLVEQLQSYTQREIVYRPKPSWRDARPIPGTTYSPPTRSLREELKDAWCLVTHGSNACLEATLAGVPAVVLGTGVTRDLGDTEIAAAVDPTFPSFTRVKRLLYNLAYLQYTAAELATEKVIRWLMQLIELSKQFREQT